MLVTPLPIVTLVKPLQPWNAETPMLMTLLGITTLVRLELFAKGLFPMAITVCPKIVLGMATAPPAPVYPVMVTPLPELV